MATLETARNDQGSDWQLRLQESGSETCPPGIPRLIWEVLATRGLKDPHAIQGWLTPTLKSIRDPFLLTDMDTAIERFVVARARQEKICIYADYDLDGTSACALLRRALEWMGYENLTHYQPSRLVEGYGLHEQAVERIAAEGSTLIVTVDLGITATHEARVAQGLGVDLIITDHHLPKEELPDALAVINPNRGNCKSGLGHLCGTGVAFYLALALRRTLLERGLIHDGFDPKNLLDCFVIGTLTDMVPLIDENRVLVKHGLLALAQTKRPGLRALLQALNLWGQPLTSQDVAIRFAPKLNALSRMELGVQPLDLYLVEDEAEAQRLVTEVLACNQMRIALQREAESTASEMLTRDPPGSCAVIASSTFHRGVVGLIATRVSQDFEIPAFVGAQNVSGSIVGSARAPEGINLLDAMSAVGDAITQFGGHAAAAGFELEEGRLNDLRDRLQKFFQDPRLSNRTSVKRYDASCELTELTPAFMSWLDHLAPFGAKFQPPVFRVRRAEVSQLKDLKGGHLRMTLVPARSVGKEAGVSVSSLAAIWFSPPTLHPARKALRPGAQIEALIEPQWNWFKGQKTLQLMIQDIRALEPVWPKARVHADLEI